MFIRIVSYETLAIFFYYLYIRVIFFFFCAVISKEAAGFEACQFQNVYTGAKGSGTTTKRGVFFLFEYLKPWKLYWDFNSDSALFRFLCCAHHQNILVLMFFNITV